MRKRKVEGESVLEIGIRAVPNSPNKSMFESNRIYAANNYNQNLNPQPQRKDLRKISFTLFILIMVFIFFLLDAYSTFRNEKDKEEKTIKYCEEQYKESKCDDLKEKDGDELRNFCHSKLVCKSQRYVYFGNVFITTLREYFFCLFSEVGFIKTLIVITVTVFLYKICKTI